jgi:hypothetical protein
LRVTKPAKMLVVGSRPDRREMSDGMPQKVPGMHAKRAAVGRRRYRPARVDGRTRTAKRARTMFAYFRELLSNRGVDVELEAAIARAAELLALAEQLRADMLRGKLISPDDLVRVERLADTSVRRLHLPPRAATPAPLSLTDYLARKGDDAA